MQKENTLVYIDELLNGEDELTDNQRSLLLNIREEAVNSEKSIDLKAVGLELLKFLYLLYTES